MVACPLAALSQEPVVPSTTLGQQQQGAVYPPGRGSALSGAQRRADANNPFKLPAGTQTGSCPQPLAHVTPGSTVTSGDWVEMERTGCLGVCPVYRVRVYANGTVQWHGSGFVTTIGDAAAQVDPAQAANLMQRMRDHGFESLCGSYRRAITDNATFITTLSVAGIVTRVSDYAASAPAWVRDFDDNIDALADTHRWRHGDPARELFAGVSAVSSHIVMDARMAKPGRTQLMEAASSPDAAKMQLLLQQKAALETEDASGWTALMYAAGAGTLEQVRLLLAAGADASHRSRMGETVLFAAAESFNNPVGKLRLLQSAGANVSAASYDGTTVLMIAANQYWQPGLVKTILDMGASASVHDHQGKTALEILDQARAAREADTPESYNAARAMLTRAK